MDILFKNHHTQTEKWLKECTLFVTVKSLSNIISSLVSLAFLAVAIYKMVCVHIIYINYFLLPILWFTVITVQYFRTVRIAKKRNAELNRKDCQVFMEVTEEGIDVVRDDSRLHAAFDHVKRGIITPNYILLLTKARILYTFRRDGFVVGNEEDFLHWLREKGIKVR